MFPFLEGKSTNYPALSFLYLLHFSTWPRDQFSCVVKFSIFNWKNLIFSHFLKKKLPKIDSQFTTLYRAPPAAKNAKNLLDHCSFSEKVISRAPRPSPTPALQGAEFQLDFSWISLRARGKNWYIPWGHFENFFDNNIFGGGTAPFAWGLFASLLNLCSTGKKNWVTFHSRQDWKSKPIFATLWKFSDFCVDRFRFLSWNSIKLCVTKRRGYLWKRSYEENALRALKMAVSRM